MLQLRDVLKVRHAVFVLGPPGSGKTAVWKTAMAALGASCAVVHPNSLTLTQLYGAHDANGMWQDGVFSDLFRRIFSHSAPTVGKRQWLVLDGPLDPRWIEPVNTILDDNKKLCLNNGDTMKLSPNTTIVLEAADVGAASPGAISRVGVVYVDADLVGWEPLVQSWLDRWPDVVQRAQLEGLVRKYVPPCLAKVGH